MDLQHKPQRAAHKISVLKRFLYFCISGVSDSGRPKVDEDVAAALIGDAELDRESCTSCRRVAPKPSGMNG